MNCSLKVGMSSGRGGGVLAAIKNTFVSYNLNLKSPVPSIDALAIKIVDLTLAVLYIPPSTQLTNYEHVLEILGESVDISKPVLILGDFNIPEFT